MASMLFALCPMYDLNAAIDLIVDIDDIVTE